jgi:hypothetical protein
LLNKATETNVNKSGRIVRYISLLHNFIIDLDGTTRDPLFFKKLHKFVDPIRPEQISAVDHSVGPQKKQ